MTTMTLGFHLASIGRRARIVGDAVEYLDGLPPPTQAELDATRADAQAAWDRQQAIAELPQRRAEMAALFDAMPIEHQALLFSTRVAVEQALDRGRPDIALQIVAAAVIPAELESTREAILALLPSP